MLHFQSARASPKDQDNNYTSIKLNANKFISNKL